MLKASFTHTCTHTLPSAAFLLLVLTYSAALYFGFVTKQLNLSWLHSHGLELLTACVLCSTALSVGLYVASFRYVHHLRCVSVNVRV